MKPSKLLAKIKSKFEKQGINLTEKRLRVLEVLCRAEQAVSAYEVVDLYKENFEESIPAMSVYRILDYLIGIKAVHKLESTNQYILCDHIACNHDHMKAQFLICDDCNSVEEIVLDKSVVSSLKKSLLDSKFALKSSQLEFHGLCTNCSVNTPA